MLICELCGQRIFGEMRQIRFRGSLVVVCEKCFAASRKTRDTPASRGGIQVHKTKIHKPDLGVRLEDKLEPVPDLGKTITERRISLGLSVRELGTRAGIRESLIKKVESGKMTLPIQELRKLERVLGIPLLRLSEEETSHGVDLKTLVKNRDKSITLGDLLAGG